MGLGVVFLLFFSFLNSLDEIENDIDWIYQTRRYERVPLTFRRCKRTTSPTYRVPCKLSISSFTHSFIHSLKFSLPTGKFNVKLPVIVLRFPEHCVIKVRSLVLHRICLCKISCFIKKKKKIHYNDIHNLILWDEILL